MLMGGKDQPIFLPASQHSWKNNPALSLPLRISLADQHTAGNHADSMDWNLVCYH